MSDTKEPKQVTSEPGEVKTSENAQAPSESKSVPVKEESKSDSSTEQAIRDAHFYEKGVKADGTGGIAPEAQ